MAKENRKHKDSVFTDLFINPNLPLRQLMYIAREYEKIVPVKDRYKSNLITIPTPEFIVFYIGIQDYPVEEILKLSTAFAEKDEVPSSEVVNVLFAEYSYETDMQVKQEEAREDAREEARKEAEKNLIEYVENVSESFDVSPEEACSKMKVPYERYLEAKRNLLKQSE